MPSIYAAKTQFEVEGVNVEKPENIDGFVRGMVQLKDYDVVGPRMPGPEDGLPCAPSIIRHEGGILCQHECI